MRGFPSGPYPANPVGALLSVFPSRLNGTCLEYAMFMALYSPSGISPESCRMSRVSEFILLSDLETRLMSSLPRSLMVSLDSAFVMPLRRSLISVHVSPMSFSDASLSRFLSRRFCSLSGVPLATSFSVYWRLLSVFCSLSSSCSRASVSISAISSIIST